ncbi:iron reductase domain protein [Zopfia rhizophila CBS 207.26]|uniref:Iron reductase domain protein n=1 Tax=Zopfia rhizophila CBS 207.26 TaxID=1314779 RepID=A0A6A6EJP6_9PEZI|nr:iron reductase domain protein [Zopfia rhizophila CBS 207.26]
MRIFKMLASVSALCTTATSQYTATKFYDRASGITWSHITHSNGVTYRVALPLTSNSSDAILQVIVPNKFAWCGLAWGGHMTNNPLSVHWNTNATTGLKALVSSRMAFGYYATPQPYDGAEYTYLKGTTSNSTHWQVTSRCQGCTRWSSSDGDYAIDSQDETQLAYACSSVPPDKPTSNTSTFNVHEQFGTWIHDLKIAKNASFANHIKNNPYKGNLRRNEGEVMEGMEEVEMMPREWRA